MWVDFGATTYISVSMQGCLRYQAPNNAKRFIYVGDGKSVEVDAIRHFRLLLKIGIYLDLKENFIVPSFRRNLVLFLFWKTWVILVLLEIVSLVFI